MKILVQIIKIILNIILVIAISLFIFINIATSTILKKDYILQVLEETKYYSEIEKEIQSNFENYIAQSGLDDEVLENIVPEEKIKNDTEIIISNIYEGTKQAVDITEIEENLKNNIEKSLDNNKLNISQKEAIEQFVNKICEQYKEAMSYTKYEDSINNVLNKINKYIDILKKVIIIAVVILIVIVLVINCKNILKGFSQIGIVLTTNGILCFIFNLYINYKIKIGDILVLNSAVSEVIKQVINDILAYMIKYGVVLVICGFVGIVVANIFNAKKGIED